MASTEETAANFPNIPFCGINPLSSPFLLAALQYSKQHTSPATVNHCLRSAYFALICSRKIPDLSSTDPDLLVYACLMHDLGWSKDPSLISKDKRFEVDGANIARQWILEHGNEAGWTKRQIQLIWDAIALHTTLSILLYKEPEVVAIGMGIAADIFGPFMPGVPITEEEYKAVATAFPKLGWSNELVDILCGLCRDKPATTYDNFVGQFGITYGLDGKGEGREAFAKEVEKDSLVIKMKEAMTACDQIVE